MKTMSEHSFEEILSDFDPLIQTIARQLRALIESVHPEAIEVVWGKQKSAGYGVGPAKMSEHYAYIYPHKKHVNWGFMYGATLPDPDGLLQGTGKNLRHIKMKTEADVVQTAVRTLLQHAFAERQKALGE